MVLEKGIELASWIIMVMLLVRFVPKDKVREAHLIFLFQQCLVWLVGTLVIEFRWIEYPERIFAYSTRASFTFEYFIYPAISVLFVLYYPSDQGWYRRVSHYVSYCTAITVIEVLLEAYTELIEYNSWTWYFTWISLFLTLYITKQYYQWFFLKYNEEEPL